MSEHEENEYLWNKSGTPDPEVRRLEDLLGRYRWTGKAVPERPRGRLLRFRTALAVAAGIAAVALIAWALRGARADGYRVIGVPGRDIVRAGEELSTGAREGVRLEIGWLGHVDVDAGSRIGVRDDGKRVHRLFLERGRVRARIWAQPRLFQIGTPAGNSIDLGCVYELDVADDGTSRLSVTDGQVAFEFEGREVYVPEGASCVSDPVRGPSAPVFDDAPTSYREALAAVEFAADPDPELVARVLDTDREGTLTLWHLVTSERAAESLRRAAYERLAKAFFQPDWVTEEGILAGDPAMREAWVAEMKPAWR